MLTLRTQLVSRTHPACDNTLSPWDESQRARSRAGAGGLRQERKHLRGAWGYNIQKYSHCPQSSCLLGERLLSFLLIIIKLLSFLPTLSEIPASHQPAMIQTRQEEDDGEMESK